MKIILAIVGYIVGILLTILILAMFSTVTNSEMPDAFIPANIGGIICAIIGYNLSKKKDENK